MKIWSEELADDEWLTANPFGGRYHVVAYGARILKAGDILTVHETLFSARTAAFLAAVRGDQRVVIVNVHDAR